MSSSEQDRLYGEVCDIAYFPSVRDYYVVRQGELPGEKIVTPGQDIQALFRGLPQDFLEGFDALPLSDGRYLLPIDRERFSSLERFDPDRIILHDESLDSLEDLFARMAIWHSRIDEPMDGLSATCELVKYWAEVRQQPIRKGFRYNILVSGVSSMRF